MLSSFNEKLGCWTQEDRPKHRTLGQPSVQNKSETISGGLTEISHIYTYLFWFVTLSI